MKKFFIILLTLAYGLSATGASLYLHYCCGKLDAVSFSVEHKDGCTTKGTKSKTCCNNVTVNLKVDADQQLLSKWAPQLTESALLTIFLPIWPTSKFTDTVLKSHYSNGPPHSIYVLPVYIKNCVFRI